MSIAKYTTNVVVAVTAVAFVFTAALPFSISSAQSAEDLEARIAELLAEISQLQGSTSTSTSTGSVSNLTSSACPYVWSRNLVIGSRGEDVRQLQVFLNSDPATRIAVSGVGSSGNETTYYGNGTASAVSKFQERYSSDVLAPFGLTSGTGNFYTSTRAHANRICASSSTTTTTTPTQDVKIGGGEVDTVVAGGLAVSEGNQPRDGYAVSGAQRVPFTTFEIRAGSSDVSIDGVLVERVGLSNDDNFTSIALVDQNGVQLGSSRSLNSDSQAIIGGRFVIPGGREVTLTVVGNVATEDDGLDSGATAALNVVEVRANTDVSGKFPITGAAHVFSEAIDLQEVEVTGLSENRDTTAEEIELNRIEEVLDFDIDVSSGDEDALLRSITLEQKGSASESDFESITFILDDDDEFTPTINGDRYTVVFPGRGYEIEEGDNVSIIVEVVAGRGTERDIEFSLDDVADVYIVGDRHGYGLPISFGEDIDELYGDQYEISGGSPEASSNTDLDSDEFDITYGDDVLLGAFEITVEDEPFEFDTPEIEFTISVGGTSGTGNTETGTRVQALWDDDIEELTLENVYLEVDGRRVANADEDYEFDLSVSGSTYSVDTVESVEFSDTFSLRESDDDYLFIIRGDLSTDWPDGATIEAEIAFDEVVGEVSDDEQEIGDITSDRVSVEGNVVDFDFSDDYVDETSVVAGSNEVIFGSLEVDTDDSKSRVELRTLELSLLTGAGTASRDIDDCRLLEGDEDGDEVADLRSDPTGSKTTASTGSNIEQVKFHFDDYEIDPEEEVDLVLVCEIDEDADIGAKFAFGWDDNDELEYSIGRDDYEVYGPSDIAASVGATGGVATLTIAGSGTVEVAIEDSGSDKVVIVATGRNGVDGVEIGEIRIRAEQEDLDVKDVVLADLAFSDSRTFDNTLKELTLWDGNDKVSNLDSGDTVSSFDRNGNGSTSDTDETDTHYVFENVDVSIDSGQTKVFTVQASFEGIDDATSATGVSGTQFTYGVVSIVTRGETSNSDANTLVSASEADDVNEVYTFRSVPTVSSSSTNRNLNSGSDRTLYEFTVSADEEGDVYLGKVSFDISKASAVTVDTFELVKGSTVLGEVAAIASGSVVITLDDAEKIDAGSSVTFRLRADIGGTIADDDTVTTSLKLDSTVVTDGVALASGDNFAWSPNSEDVFGGPADTDTDWFNSAEIIDSDDVQDYILEK